VFHSDSKTPNLDINEEKGAFICRACGKAGKLTDLARHLGVAFERRPQEDYKLSDENAMWLLKKQGISSETVEHFSIKADYKKQAWQYPIFQWKTNTLLGYRFKSYDATAARKYWETGNIGAVPYFGQVDGPVIFLTEGEKDCWLLSQNELPAMCITGSATSVPDDLAEALRANGIEEVRIVYDLDGAGEEGAKKVVEALGEQFTVKVLQLPKSLGKGGDCADLKRIKGDKFKGAIENLPVASLTNRVYDENDIVARVAREGFLRSYVQYCKGKTDAPLIFHLGVGLGILGAAMENNVQIPSWADQVLFPNLWIVLIAPSGFMRKSAALGMGKRLLRSAVPKAILSDDATPEKLARILQDNPAGLLTVSEFTRLLAMLSKEYNAGMMQMLTELYDSPATWTMERQSSAKVTIENVSISMLGATTLDWLQGKAEQKHLRGGFLARFLFLPATERGERVKQQPDANFHIREPLKEWLLDVSNLKGVADYSEVWSDFDDWLYNYERLAESGGMPPELMGLYSRTGTMALKLALIFQASLKPQLKITPEAMKAAQQFIEYIHRVTLKVTKTFTQGWFGQQCSRVLGYLGSQGGESSRKDLARFMQIEGYKLDNVVNALKEQDKIEERVDKKTGQRGRPPRMYALKDGE